MNTRVYVLYTGGTLGMAPNNPSDPDSPLIPRPLHQVLAQLPCLTRNPTSESNTLSVTLDNGNQINLDCASITPIDSADMTPDHWLTIAQHIAAVYDDYDGFVILHGTDAMAYTSSALSFLCENLAKPIVITGSQLPIAAPDTDAIANVTHALHIAGYQASGLPLIPEVMIAFADKIIRGCRATKISTTHRSAFDSPNYPLLGTIGERIIVNTSVIQPVPINSHCFVHATMVPHIGYLTIYPGCMTSTLRQMLLSPDYTGLVLRTYGSGTTPSQTDFLTLIEQSVRGDAWIAGRIQPNSVPNGRLVVNISQCPQGAVQMGLYASSQALLERGVLPGFDMTAEAALTKLMWTLGTPQETACRVRMQTNQRGELTEL